jgi:hypothetical protein
LFCSQIVFPTPSERCETSSRTITPSTRPIVVPADSQLPTPMQDVVPTCCDQCHQSTANGDCGCFLYPTDITVAPGSQSTPSPIPTAVTITSPEESRGACRDCGEFVSTETWTCSCAGSKSSDYTSCRPVSNAAEKRSSNVRALPMFLADRSLHEARARGNGTLLFLSHGPDVFLCLPSYFESNCNIYCATEGLDA